MKIGCLGTGVWGFCIASLLASKGHTVTSWTRELDLADKLNRTREHPFLPGHPAPVNMSFTTDIQEAMDGIDLLVESVTSAGIRPVFEKIKSHRLPNCPIVLTSKGIEQGSGLILPQVIIEILGPESKKLVACLSGPSFAKEVIQHLPTLVVLAAYDAQLMQYICEVFSTNTFRVYPNSDVDGVSYGGALKNIIAISCGIAEGMGLGLSTRAALMTRGLHEIRKLATAYGCRAETINGLSGLGDLCLTCSSHISRNCHFGYLLAKGLTPQEAQKEIGMVVEGVYTCVSALQLSRQSHVSMPITEAVYKVIYDGLLVNDALKGLMERTVKEEHL